MKNYNAKYFLYISICFIIFFHSNIVCAQTLGDTIQSTTLDNVVVEASNVNYKGNLITNVFTDSDVKKSYNAGALLGTAQGMYYDRITRQLTYLGSGNIVVLIDGLPKPLDFIISQNPNKYLKVEITVNPVGQYAGYDAVVNLITKPKYEGYNGRILTDNWVNPSMPYSKGDFFGQTHDELSFAYTKNKWTVEAFGNYIWERTGTSSHIDEEYPLNNIVRQQSPYADKNPSNMKYHRGGLYYLTLGYQINPNHKISFQWYSNFLHESGFSNYQLLTRNIENKNESIVEQWQKTKDITFANFFGLYYQGYVKGWQLYANVSDYIVPRKFYSILTDSDNKILDSSRKMDYNYLAGVLNASKGFDDGKLKLSLSDDFTYTNSAYKNYYTLSSLSKNHDLKNSLYAGLGYYPDYKLSTSVSAGLITERLSDDTFSKTYLYPRIDAMLSYQPTQNFIGRLNYTARTNYAYLGDIQDYGYFYDWLNYIEGNPRLKPAWTHTVNFFANVGQTFDFSATYSYSGNGIAEIYTPAFGMRPDGSEGNYVYRTSENGKSHNVSIYANWYTFIKNHFVTQFRASIDYAHFEYQEFSNSRWYPGAQVDLAYMGLGNTLMAGVQYKLNNYQLVAPQEIAYGMKDSFTAMVQKSWFGNKFTAILMYQLPLHIASGDFTKKLNSIPYKYTAWSNNQWRNDNRITVVLEYSISGGQQVRSNDKTLNLR